MYFVHVLNNSYIDQSNDTIKCSVQRRSGCKYCQDLPVQQVWQNVWDIAKTSTEYLLGASPVADTKMQFAIKFYVHAQRPHLWNN